MTFSPNPFFFLSPSLPYSPLPCQAPEVLDGDSYRASADLFSLGAIVYQCYTGQPPFRASNIRALKELHRKGIAPTLRPVRVMRNEIWKDLGCLFIRLDS